MQLGDKKLVVQRASVGAKGSMGAQAPVTVQVLYVHTLIYGCVRLRILQPVVVL